MTEQKSYDPTTPIGRHNLKEYLYERKSQILMFSIGLIFVLIIFAYFLYRGGRTEEAPKMEIQYPPPPRYGYGPYGYGLYAPTKETFDNL